MIADIPNLTTPRLTLRGPILADFPVIADFFQTDRSQWIGGPLDRAAVWGGFCASAGQWLLRGYGFWQAVLTDTGTLIGRAGIYHPENWPEPELSWSIYSPEAEGKGLAFEMAQAALQGAADLGLRNPISSIDAGNMRSIRLAERMGAHHEGDWQSPYGPMLTYRHKSPA